MSFTAMSWASKQKTKTASQKLVLLMLANYADDTDKCWPSKKTLSEVCCMAKSAICSNILQLEQSGFIRVEKREGTSSYIWLNTGVLQEDRGCPLKGQGVSVKRTGGVLLRDTNLSMNQSNEPITETNILVDADFDAFWAAYPKRPINPKAPAKKSYLAARKGNVSHETIMAGVNAYAEMRVNEDPKFTAQAVTWLNQRRWADEYDVPQTKAAVPIASDEQMAAITEVYKGPTGDIDRAKANLAAELAKGIGLEEIITAAKKHTLYIKQMRQNGMDMAMPTLETWIKFKWRDMDGYEIYRNPVERHPVLRPVRDKRK